jgi:phage prohead protease, HK97 family
MGMEKERRLTMEIRAADNSPPEEMIVEGYAVRFNERTMLYELDGVQYFEVIERGALDTADISDVPMKYNHSDHVMIMARTRSKTLTLTRDDQGLFIQARLANTTAGRDLFELVRRGDIDKMSFAFTVEEDDYNRDTRTRSIKKIKKLWDVAAVDTPAYDTTSISARSFFEAEAEKERKALESAEWRRKLLLKTYL